MFKTIAAYQSNGTSLLELMVTLALSCLIALQIIPNLVQDTQRYHQQYNLEVLMRALQKARLQAVLYQEIISLCPIPNNHACCSANWQHPILVYQGAPTSCPIRNATPIQYFYWAGHPSIKKVGPQQHRFLADGSAEGYQAHWTIQQGHHMQRIIINRQGRIRFTTS